MEAVRTHSFPPARVCVCVLFEQNHRGLGLGRILILKRSSDSNSS